MDKGIELTSSDRRRRLVPLLLLLVVTVAVYGRILGHDFIFSWDDYYYVASNEAIKAISWQNIRTVFSSYYVGNYAPVQMLSYMLDHAIWGMKAGGFLFVNLLLHLLNGLLVYRLLYRFNASANVAVCGAAVFLLHPLQVETVAWISQRKNLLALLFFLLAWELYCRYRQQLSYRKTTYILSLVAYILGGLSKSVVVTLPLVLLLDDFSASAPEQRRWLDKVPFLAIATGIAWLAILSQQPDNLTWGGGTAGGLSDFHGGSPYATFLTMLPVLCRYLWLIVWPVKLSVLYDQTVYTAINGQVIGAAVFIALLVLLTVVLFRQNRRYGFWSLFFLTTLLPVSQLVPLVTLMNDRYLYFPMIGIAGLSGAVAAKSIERFGRKGWLLIVPVVLLFAALSFQRAGAWRDDITLWKDTALKTPARAEVWQNLAVSLQSSPLDHKKEAIAAYERSYALTRRDTTLYLLGTVYQELKEYNKALVYFQQVVDNDPDNVMGLTALGNTYRLMGEYDKAELLLLRAFQLQPEASEIVRFLNLLRSDREKSSRVASVYSTVKENRK